jgi:hypothetical protein
MSLAYFLIIKANEMLCFSNLFDKVLYVFLTDLLSIIRSLNTVLHSDLASRQSTELALQIPVAVYTVLRLLMMDSRSVRNM